MNGLARQHRRYLDRNQFQQGLEIERLVERFFQVIELGQAVDGIEQILPLLLVLLCRPEGSDGQFREPFKRLQRGLGKRVAEADDLEGPDQFLLPQ